MPEIVASQALALVVFLTCIAVGVGLIVFLGPPVARKVLRNESGLAHNLIRIVTMALSLFIVALSLAVSRGVMGTAKPWHIAVSLVLPSFLMTFAALALIWAGAVGQVAPVLAPWPLRALAAAATGLAVWLTLAAACPGPVCLEAQSVAVAGIVLVVTIALKELPTLPKLLYRTIGQRRWTRPRAQEPEIELPSGLPWMARLPKERE